VVPALARLAGDDPADAVDVPLHAMATEPARRGGGALQVDPLIDHERAKRRPVESLLHDVGGGDLAVHIGHREADAVAGDRVAGAGVGGDERSADGEHGSVAVPVEAGHAAQLLDDPGEHQRPFGSAAMRRSGPTRRTSVISRSIASATVAIPAVARAAGPSPSSFGAM